MANIGMQASKPLANKTKETKENKVLSVENVREDLLEQIGKVGNNNFKPIAQLASSYLLTSKAFREYCLNDTSDNYKLEEDKTKCLSNLLMIYNGVYLEKTMTEALKEGKINSQTEEYLKEEMQAFTNSGTEQVVNWIMQDSKDIVVKKINGEDKYEEEIEIEADVYKKTEEQYETIFDIMKKQAVEDDSND